MAFWLETGRTLTEEDVQAMIRKAFRIGGEFGGPGKLRALQGKQRLCREMILAAVEFRRRSQAEIVVECD